MNHPIAPPRKLSSIAVAVALASVAAVPAVAWAQGVNQNCPEESVYYNPGNGEDIIVPKGFKVEVFASGLNFPTDVAFVGGKDDFKVYVLESGTGLPGRCNNRNGIPAENGHPPKPYPGDPTGF